ncbi:hypothetical protein EVAR_55810_1 [Eumeta japonica]|uniref:Histone-lysine N-methyltransferase SETMAR n=1 Tax=Eumeta variegata TaxID=151549 RepID=A0A4C1Z8X1_EUMVA|nr:hypothetical protein EVAR_55810_1 [Eumeta japonica]
MSFYCKGKTRFGSLLTTADDTQARSRVKRPELINRKGVVFHHYKARLHTSLATQQLLREFEGLEVLPCRSNTCERLFMVIIADVVTTAATDGSKRTLRDR